MDYLLGLAHRQLIDELEKMPETSSLVSQTVAAFKSSVNALFGGSPALPLII